MIRRRAAPPRRVVPAVLLLVVGVLLAVGAPAVWSLTHRDPALTPIGPGVAVALARSGAASGTVTAEMISPTTDLPAPQNSATLAAVPTATTPTTAAVPPSGDHARPTTASGGPGTTHWSPASSTAAGKPTRPSVTAPKSTAGKPTRPVAPPVRPPARLRIPSIGVDAPVGPVGIDDRGKMAIPEQVQDIGWYRYGPAPGAAAGSAVLSGHVDSAQQGLGAFSRLGELHAGDRVTVIDTSGRQLPYRVVGKEAFDKSSVPLADLFSRSGAARLTLITCGGAFDSASLSYLDNIVVTAVPA